MRVTMLIRRLVLAAMLLGGGLAPAMAENNSMYWPVRSNHPYQVQVAFYSEWRNWEWPGAGQAYNLDDSETHGFNLSCTPGEKICMGAWEKGNSHIYWGVGFSRRNACSACCYICGDGQIPTQVLNPPD